MICTDCGREFQIVQINKTKAVCICQSDCEYNKRSNVIVINRHYLHINKPDKKEVATANKQEDLDEFLLDVFNQYCNNTDYNAVSEGHNSNNLQNQFPESNLEIETFDMNNESKNLQPTDYCFTDVSPDFLDMFLPKTNK